MGIMKGSSQIVKDPLISVVLPVFNGAPYLVDAIESVRAQSYKPIELIVVNDGSTDNTAEIATNFHDIRYSYQSNKGFASARNAGLKIARGDFIAFIDSDDIWLPDKLKSQMSFLSKHADVGYVISWIRNFSDHATEGCNENHRIPLPENQIGIATMLVRKTVFDCVGHFNTHFHYGTADLDWCARAKDLNIRKVILPRVVMLRRIHQSNLSLGSCRERTLQWFDIFRMSIERQRKRKGT